MRQFLYFVCKVFHEVEAIRQAVCREKSSFNQSSGVCCKSGVSCLVLQPVSIDVLSKSGPW